jgi:hypothetical protein
MPLYRCDCGSCVWRRLWSPRPLGGGRYTVRCGKCRREWMLKLPVVLDFVLHLAAHILGLLVFIVPLVVLPPPISVVVSVLGSAATFIIIQFGLLLLQPLEQPPG